MWSLPRWLGGNSDASRGARFAGKGWNKSMGPYLDIHLIQSPILTRPERVVGGRWVSEGAETVKPKLASHVQSFGANCAQVQSVRGSMEGGRGGGEARPARGDAPGSPRAPSPLPHRHCGHATRRARVDAHPTEVDVDSSPAEVSLGRANIGRWRLQPGEAAVAVELRTECR